MWIFTRHGLISIVEDQPLSIRVPLGAKEKPHKPLPNLIVRARERRPLQQLFRGCRIIPNAGTDYQFRCIVPRAEVARVIASEIETMTYGNFKGSVADNAYHNVLMRVWSTVANFYAPKRPAIRRGVWMDGDDPGFDFD